MAANPHIINAMHRQQMQRDYNRRVENLEDEIETLSAQVRKYKSLSDTALSLREYKNDRDYWATFWKNFIVWVSERVKIEQNYNLLPTKTPSEQIKWKRKFNLTLTARSFALTYERLGPFYSMRWANYIFSELLEGHDVPNELIADAKELIVKYNTFKKPVSNFAGQQELFENYYEFLKANAKYNNPTDTFPCNHDELFNYHNILQALKMAKKYDIDIQANLPGNEEELGQANLMCSRMFEFAKSLFL